MSTTTLKKKLHSDIKVKELSRKLQKYNEIADFEHLTIYATGSYARLEASEFSDIDLFFVTDSDFWTLNEPKIKKIRLFSKIVEIVDEMNFPKFSNDGEFLEIIQKSEMLQYLGGRDDDHKNLFTARMLLLLESRCVFNPMVHKSILGEIVQSYFRDYPDHPENFKPTFLVNDILRFWKTLCLNYEHKRNQPTDDSQKRIRQKIKNFKLKHSRLLTCFATVALISSFKEPVSKDQIIDITELTPMERILKISSGNQRVHELREDIQSAYDWFLQITDISEDNLVTKFNDRDFRVSAFERATKFGDMVYNLTREISDENSYMRYLLV